HFTEQRDVDLREHRPDRTRFRIVLQRNDEARRARIIHDNVVEMEGGVGGADSSLDRAAGEIEDRSGRLCALFVDPELLVESSDTLDVLKRRLRVAFVHRRVAEEIEIGNVRGFGPGGDCGRRPAGPGGADGPTQSRRYGGFVYCADNMVEARVVGFGIPD